MEVFKSVCKLKLEIPDDVINDWKEKIEKQYQDRHYHNLNMIEKKMEVIREFTDDEVLSCALILASIFQYYHFDAKDDIVSDNCEEFKMFVEQAGIKDVSLPQFISKISNTNSHKFFSLRLSIEFCVCSRTIR